MHPNALPYSIIQHHTHLNPNSLDLHLNPKQSVVSSSYNINLTNMTSVIRQLMQQYRSRVAQQTQWSVTSQSKLHQSRISKKIGELFLSLIITLLLDEQGLPAEQKEVSKNRAKLLQKLQLKQKEQQQVIERVLGIFMIDLMRKDQKFSSIYQELDLLFDPEVPQEETYDFNSEEQDNESSIYTSSTNASKMTNSNAEVFMKLIRDQTIMSYNESEPEDSSHQKRVSQYITKLSAPQTEISYLCQHFGWKSNFRDRMLENGTFEVSTQIDFEFKNFKRQLVAKASYKNKKMARMLSAAKLLRSLYISFPQIWKIYAKIRDQKSLIIPQDDLNCKLIKQAIKEKVEIVKMDKGKQNDFEMQLKGYLNDISSFKSEMNILLQQVTGVFTHPKMDKMAFQGKWKVKGELRITIRQTGFTKTYYEVEVSLGAKLAEQMVAKKLLTAMYGEHRDILQTMAMLKKKKGFKT